MQRKEFASLFATEVADELVVTKLSFRFQHSAAKNTGMEAQAQRYESTVHKVP